MMPTSRFRESTVSLETVRERILTLVTRFPECHIHVLDAAYRLTSPRSDASNVRMWEDQRGELVGFGVWQPAFKMLEYGFDPHAEVRPIAEDILDWAVDSFTTQAKQGEAPLTCWIKVL